MESYSFKEFLKPDFEPSDYAPTPTKLGTIAFWSFFALVAFFAS